MEVDVLRGQLFTESDASANPVEIPRTAQVNSLNVRDGAKDAVGKAGRVEFWLVPRKYQLADGTCAITTQVHEVWEFVSLQIVTLLAHT